MTSPADRQDRLDPQSLPFAAPCRTLALSAPLAWIGRGWADLRRAPAQSLSYGLVTAILSLAMVAGALHFGNIYLMFALLSGFIFIGPPLAFGLYSISRQLQRGQQPRLGRCLREGRRQLGSALVFAVMLLIVFLVWARAASMVHVFFPARAEFVWEDLLPFLAVGTLVGSLFAGIVFAASAYSLPMLLDRQVDTVTAVVTSINAVLRNKGAMAVWAGIIVVSLALAFATGFLALVLIMPLLGHATWHAYQDTIDASAWPPS